MNKARLTKLANFLNTVPAKHFNLETYCEPNGYSTNSWIGYWDKGQEFVAAFKSLLAENFEFTMRQIADSQKETDCGTTACAVGWCPAVFPEHFQWSKYNNGVQLISDPNTDNLDAACTFFGIKLNEAEYFFMPNYYAKDKSGPKDVAKRILAVVKTGKFPKKPKMYDDEYYE